MLIIKQIEIKKAGKYHLNARSHYSKLGSDLCRPKSRDMRNSIEVNQSRLNVRTTEVAPTSEKVPVLLQGDF